MFSLLNKNILITGASSGIGKQTAISCAQLGARLILFGRNSERLSEVADSLNGSGHSYFAFDLSDHKQLEQSLYEAISQSGIIDGYVHSAGIHKILPFKSSDPGILNNQFNINVTSGLETLRILLRKNYINQNGGSVIFISSINGIYGVAGQVAYSASKGAIISAVKSLAIELASNNIRVNSISPGMVEDTNISNKIKQQLSSEWVMRSKAEYPLGWISTEDVANACIFLLSEASQRITGINLIVDGGFSAK